MDVSAAIERIYYKSFGLLLWMGRTQYGLSRDIAMEMIQETFTKVWKNRTRITSTTTAGIRGYVIRSFRRTCIDFLQRPRIFAENVQLQNGCDGDTPSHVDMAADPSMHPLYELLLVEEERLQREVVSTLPDKYREVVALSLQGVNPKTIAGKLKIKDSTVRTLKKRGLEIYKDEINKRDPLRDK